MTDLLQSLFYGFPSQYGGLNSNTNSINTNSISNSNNNKTSTIIVVVVIIIILIGVCVYYYKSNEKPTTTIITPKQESTTPKQESTTPSVTNNQYDYLKCETTNVTNMPKDCLKKMWFDLGCKESNIPSDFFTNQEVDRNMKNNKGEPASYNEISEFQKNLTSSYSYSKEMCYGTDKSKWPPSACNKYNHDSKNIDIDCLSELYSKKCPNFDKTKLHSSYLEKSKEYTLENLEGLILLAQQPENCNLLYEPIPTQ